MPQEKEKILFDTPLLRHWRPGWSSHCTAGMLLTGSNQTLLALVFLFGFFLYLVAGTDILEPSVTFTVPEIPQFRN